MANEISGQLQLNVVNGEFSRLVSAAFRADQAAVGGGNPGTVIIGTAEENISLGLSSPGYIYMKNIGSHDIRWGLDNVGSIVTMGYLYPGEISLWRYDNDTGNTIRMQAVSVESEILILAYED